jgi:hypothetical protein
VKIRWAATTNALVTGHDRGGESVEREREQELLDCRHEAHHPVGDRLRAVTLLPYGWPREYAQICTTSSTGMWSWATPVSWLLCLSLARWGLWP